MSDNLTKKTVRIVPTLELAMRFNRLLLTADTMPAHVLTMADAREALLIEDELRRRLVVAIGHDFYPPEGVAKPTMAELKARLSPFKKSKAAPAPKPVQPAAPKPVPKPVPKVVQPVAQEDGKIGFKVAILNSMGGKVTTLNLHVNGKGDAEAAARKTIKQLGLKKATFKIG